MLRMTRHRVVGQCQDVPDVIEHRCGLDYYIDLRYVQHAMKELLIGVVADRVLASVARGHLGNFRNDCVCSLTGTEQGARKMCFLRNEPKCVGRGRAWNWLGDRELGIVSRRKMRPEGTQNEPRTTPKQLSNEVIRLRIDVI